MAMLRVDPEGLSAFASSCSAEAIALRTSLIGADPGPEWQTSATTVVAADGRISAAAAALAARTEEMSQALDSAAAEYRMRDHSSAEPIAEIMFGADR